MQPLTIKNNVPFVDSGKELTRVIASSDGEMASITPRKRKVLDLKDRIKVIERHEKGETAIAIAQSLECRNRSWKDGKMARQALGNKNVGKRCTQR